MQKIKEFQLEDNSITKDKIKLTGNDALTGEDIRINENTSETVNNNFSIIDSNINNLNNSTNNLSQQLSQIISYEKNVIELPITETLSAFIPVGFDSNGNVKKFTESIVVNSSTSTVKTLTYFSDWGFYGSIHKIITNIGERILFQYETNLSGYPPKCYLYTADEAFILKTNRLFSGATNSCVHICNSYFTLEYGGGTYYIKPVFISNDTITEGSSYLTIGGNFIFVQGDNCSININNSYYIKYIYSGSYTQQNISYTLSNSSKIALPYSFIEYTSSQFVVHHFTNYWPCKLKTEYIYNIPSGITVNAICYTPSGYFIDVTNNKILWDDNDGQGIKIINSPVANIRQICQLYNNWFIIFGSNTYKIVPSISTTLNYNNYPTFNHSYNIPVLGNYGNWFANNNAKFTFVTSISESSIFAYCTFDTKSLTVFKVNHSFSQSNFTGILLENANQGEIKKIATSGSIITIPNSNFIPGRYYIFNASTNTYEQTSDNNNAIFKALTNNKVYILDNLG